MLTNSFLHRRLAQLMAPNAPIHTIPSPDKRWIARAQADPSTDLLTWEILSADKPLETQQHVDRICEAYPSGIAWMQDGSGFFYDRILPFSGGHGLYFHTIGTTQRQDHCVIYHAEHPDWYYQPHVSPDGLWLAVSILNHSAANRLSLFALPEQGLLALGKEIPLIDQFVGRYDLCGWQKSSLILRAVESDAPNGRLLAVEFPTAARTHILPEGNLPLLDAAPLGEGWVASYLCQGWAKLVWFDSHGVSSKTIPLPGLGTVELFQADGKSAPDLLHFSYTDYTQPAQLYRWRQGEEMPQRVKSENNFTFDPAEFVTRAHLLPSRDGTRVPVFLAHRRNLVLRNCPTLLTAYGGMGHLFTPRFSGDALAWMEMGGLFVAVCARGGGELGAAWHQAAVGVHKQRTFDDVLAAASWLIAQGITTPAQLGLWGISNGGLTIGACLTQTPHLFGAVVIESGLLDMLHYHQLGQGSVWLHEYGDPEELSQRAVLAAYSPLHSIQMGESYPPTLIVTHEQDPRVGAAHSLRFARALTEAQAGVAPVQLRIHTGSGHGPPAEGEPWLNWTVERLAFLAHHLGISL